MKRLTGFAMAILLLLIMTACDNSSSSNTTPPEDEQNIFLVTVYSDYDYIDILEKIEENNWYLIDVSVSDERKTPATYYITYSKTPVFSQCTNCNATTEQMN